MRNLYIKNISRTDSVDVSVITFNNYSEPISAIILPEGDLQKEVGKAIQYLVISQNKNVIWEGPVPISDHPIIIDPNTKKVEYRSRPLVSLIKNKQQNQNYNKTATILILAVAIFLAFIVYKKYSK